MQERQFERLLTDKVLDLRPSGPAQIRRRMKSIEEANNKAYAKSQPPPETRNYERTPTAEELASFREWAIEYKKKVPGITKRQLRKAVQEHFHIRIFK
jgi:hypothetical protein